MPRSVLKENKTPSNPRVKSLAKADSATNSYQNKPALGRCLADALAHLKFPALTNFSESLSTVSDNHFGEKVFLLKKICFYYNDRSNPTEEIGFLDF